MKNQFRIMTILLIVVGASLVAHPLFATLPDPCGGIPEGFDTRDWTSPSTGNVVGITIVVEFSDSDSLPAIDMVDIEAFLNQDGYSGHGNNGSVHDYFYDISCGALNYTNTLYHLTFLADHPRDDYATGPMSLAEELAEGALALMVQNGFDFSDYDSNDDGVIDAINILAQGSGFDQGSALHPHFGSIDVSLGDFTASYFQISNIGENLELGTFCHENGHMLCGWYDYYPNSVSGRGVLGSYCLMGSGSRLNPLNPPHPNAYSKIRAGWSTPLVLDSDQSVQALHETCSIAIIPHPDPENIESYIIENRQNIGRDAGIGESGLAIYKIEAGAYEGFAVNLVQADNNNHVDDSTNLWAEPENDRFHYCSIPAPFWTVGSPSEFYLSNISQPDSAMTYEFGFYEMIPVKITTDPVGILAEWTLTGPGGCEFTGVGEYDLLLGKTGPFTVEYSCPNYSPPNPVSVTIDLSAVTDSCVVFSTHFDTPLEIYAGGDLGDPSGATTVCAVDFNNDGREDLFVGNSDGNNLILLGDSNGGFQDNSAPEILALAQGVKHAAWGDIDNDGDMDVFVVRENGEHLLLQNSSGTLVDIMSQSPGFAELGEVSSVALIDVNRNGNLDCFIVHHDSPNELFIGDGSGTFTIGNAGDAGGVMPVNADYSYWSDFRSGGYSGVLVNSETSTSKLFNNIDGVLTYVVTEPYSAGQSVGTWGDFDNDGRLDLIRFNASGDEIEFWKQDAWFNFTEIILDTNLHLLNSDVTSINLVDFNNDGFLDLYITVLNGHDIIFLNTGGEYVPGLIPIPLINLPQTAGASVAATIIDANGDGAMDVYVVCDGEPNFLLKNDLYDRGNWIKFDVSSISQNAGAVGARIDVYAENANPVVREVANSGAPGQNSSIVHFGLGDLSSVPGAHVFWGGDSPPTFLRSPALNQSHFLTEPDPLNPLFIGISEVAEYPILSGGDNNSIFAVHIENNGSTSMIVEADLTSLGGSSEAFLRDDGVGSDIVAGDWVFTSAPFSSSVVAGQYSVDVSAMGTIPPDAFQSVSVEVIESQLLMVDGSGDTGDLSQLDGDPYAGIYFDTPVGGVSENILVVSKDSSTDPGVFKQDFIINGAPNMEKKNNDWFQAGYYPAIGSRGVYAADFDNDGDEDLFICHNNQETRLYENTGNGFSDVTTMFGGNESLLSGAHVAAWGDYNQDGKLDIFVATMNYTGSMATLADNIGTVTNSQWFLFKNTGTSFELALDSMYTTGGFALSASWNDVNNDGLLDLVVGELQGGANGSPTVILNEGYKKILGHYLLTEDPVTAHITGLTVNSLDWIDYDHNNLPDLVVTEFTPSFGAHILRNTGNGFEVAVTLTSDGSWTGSIVADFNQDGQDDVVLLPINGMPALFVGDQATNPTYKELAYPLGLRQGATSGGFAADFNNDKDLDLYLGRANTDQFLYKNQRVNGNDPVTGDQDWIRFDLTTIGNSNASLIGARITVVGDTKQWIQTVDGGSGRGGQRSNELHFGLGNASGSVDVILDWPGSIPPNPITYSSLAINTVHAIADTACPHVIVGSSEFLPEPSPTGADWVFEWRTVEHGNVELDKVEIDFGGYFPGDYCYVGLDMTLEFATPDVDMTIFPVLPSGWKHRVVWSNQSCLGDSICGFQFKVGSGVESPQGVQTLTEGPWVNFGEFDVCITKKSITN